MIWLSYCANLAKRGHGING